jgi:hypothetical protein
VRGRGRKTQQPRWGSKMGESDGGGGRIVFGGILVMSPESGDGRDQCKERAGLFRNVGKPYLAY